PISGLFVPPRASPASSRRPLLVSLLPSFLLSSPPFSPSSPFSLPSFLSFLPPSPSSSSSPSFPAYQFNEDAARRELFPARHPSDPPLRDGLQSIGQEKLRNNRTAVPLGELDKVRREAGEALVLRTAEKT